MNNYLPRSKIIFYYFLTYLCFVLHCVFGHSDSTLYKVFFIFHLIKKKSIHLV